MREVPGPPGAPVLFLAHGLSATADLNWWFSYEGLGRHFRVLAMDHRGHGRGIRSGTRFRLADCADDMVAVADALGVDKFIPVGYSMGGAISQLVWYRQPERVDGLVLCATSRDFRGSPVDWLSYAALPWISIGARAVPWSPVRGLATQVLSRALAKVPHGVWMMEELLRGDVGTILEATASLGRFTSREWITGVDIPVGVVATAVDSLVPIRRQMKLANAVPMATVHLADGDHFLARKDRQSFVAALEDACMQVARRSSGLNDACA